MNFCALATSAATGSAGTATASGGAPWRSSTHTRHAPAHATRVGRTVAATTAAAATTTAAAAAAIILDGVKADQRRILVGDDAHRLDDLVRRSPEQAHDLDFFESLAREVGWRLGP